ncbi:aldose epimerase family protein [Shewanella intestini]|uniref:Aldose 1-epimerase n=1 Tax=Shewanella intestini TaxID=2017544 RepID=A0ABS5I775_9GAMM|nr:MULTISPECIES: aldose epimerase family protein [Shewanella]MBR9729584.1 galactose mutarotase [Shewanella intestini]MRG37654.1 galactose-1-epimerase [Shewanella sp. XMDDZSB0408]
MVSYQPQQAWQDPRGGEVQRVVIDNGIIAMEVLSLGGIIRSLSTADKHGQRDNIVLGCDSVADYLTQQAYLGAIAGRYANRIANGQFHLNGVDYPLSVNQASNCLHGGEAGFHQKHWQMSQVANGVRLTLTSPDGDMGFPGECQVQLDYLLDGDSLVVEMHANVNKTCPISLTQHSYFNLAGQQSRSNHQHLIQVDAKQYLSMNDVGVPTGIHPTANSDLDLQQATPMAVQQQRSALAATQGFDHCYVLEQTQGLARFGCLSEPTTGRTMTVYTNQPGVQLYGANFLGGNIGFEQQHYQQHQAVCIEPQMLPDSPNQAHLPGNAFIKPNETYHHLSRYQFGLIGQ